MVLLLSYFVTSLFLVNCQINLDILKTKPEKCYGDEKLMGRRCCIFPPFFKRDVARSCGGLFALVGIDNEHNVTNLRRDNNNKICIMYLTDGNYFTPKIFRLLNNLFNCLFNFTQISLALCKSDNEIVFKDKCDYWKCLLEKYTMLDPGNTLNIEKYYSHLDRWITLNPDFGTAVSNAKMHCREEFRLYLPLTTCEFFEFQKCIRGFVNVHCPVIIQSKECLEWKEFYEECSQFFL